MIAQIALPLEAVDYQPRYLAYCRAHGRTPEAMLAHDSDAWPGGRLCGFILWISDRWHEWRVATGSRAHALDRKTDAEHAAFDAWLNGVTQRRIR